MTAIAKENVTMTQFDRGRGINATRVVASTLGVIAGLLGLEHGYFETLQGNLTPSGIVISAIGAPCQVNEAWNGCEPAMTIVPSFFVTGILAIVASLIVIVWAAVFVRRKHGGMVLILLSVAQLFVGGGFSPPLLGMIAGAAGSGIDAPLTWWRAHLSLRSKHVLAKLWPWPLIACVGWSCGEDILGYFFNDALRNLLPLTIVLSLGLPLLSVLTGFASDIQRQTGVSPSY